MMMRWDTTIPLGDGAESLSLPLQVFENSFMYSFEPCWLKTLYSFEATA